MVTKWLVKEEGSDAALGLAQFWRSQAIRPVAPQFMVLEVANALHKRILRGELGVSDAARLLEDLLASGIELRDSPELLHRTLELSNQLNQGAVYDSHYLALAESLNCDLWTADRRFFRAAFPVAPHVRLLAEFVAS